ncbi:MAG: MlaD family protein [Gemmatimonadota bacterium]
MARRLSWSDVRGGIIAASILAVAAVATLRFSRLGTLHGDTFMMYARVGEARGILKGSEVWLSGQKIGKIVSIEFRSPTVSDTGNRVEIAMEALEKYRGNIHRDAVAQIRPGGSFIGAPVMYLTPGTSAAPVLQPGDSVTTHPQADVEGAASKFGVASREFPVIINNFKSIAGHLSSTEGTVGAFLNSGTGPGSGQFQRTGRELGRLGSSLHTGGTVSLAMNGSLQARAGHVMARADSVRALLASNETSLGRMRRDSSLMNEIGDIRNELSLVQAQLDGSMGTAGRALHDSAVTHAIADAQRQMTSLFADMKKHPFRYIRF